LTESRYVVRPKGDQDLDDQAFYYATEVNPELGHRFLVSAHGTFALLATQPGMGWNRSSDTLTSEISAFSV
jgi:plasmid stabilization system protein ParE